MKRNTLLLLIFCNLAWAANPLMGKLLLRAFNGVQVAWLRYFSAFLIYLIVVSFFVFFRQGKWRDYFLWPQKFRQKLELLLLGTGPFVFSPILQFVGLESAQAMDNSILFATEPLITVLLAWGVLGEKMTRRQAVSMGIAILGFLFFSGVIGPNPEIALSSGLFLLLMAQVGEAGYSVFGRKLVRDFKPAAILGSGLAIAAVTLTLFVWVFDEFPKTDVLQNSSNWGPLLWLGPVGSTLTYLIWVMVARSVKVPVMAMTLFIQAVFGAFLGFLFLGERLTLFRGFGAFLIVVAITVFSVREMVSIQNKDSNSSV